ncbi:MAG: helix-turn-helix transcriptional regulator [Bacteroides sp.]|nr:helix-turn-helix transcriptional regulator [Bacteroides sp.]MCM1380191.1 helix-turn-helix transcriptional regulator [Bacteroides sp.]MCM1446494.1 helix-turn-helix transcriptional regulator [Prevotella sp.]
MRKLALEVGTNENYLKTGFRYEFGLTVYGYLFERRMLAARQLLLDTSLPIGQIARIAGYTDPVGFYQPFRRRFGLTSTQFRATKFHL